MISKMNYLLLSAIMVTAIDSTFGRCCHCPCGKEGEKKIKGKETIAGIGFQLHEPYSNQKNELINNTDNGEQLETIKNEENNKDGNESLENQNDNEKKLIDEIIAEALKNNVICNVCINTKDSESKIKLVFDDHATRVKGYKSLKTVVLEFDFCEKHKECIVDSCEEEAEYLFQCGHRMCETHYRAKMSGKKGKVWSCRNCTICMCCLAKQEGFGIHLWCNALGKKHYVCFKGKDSENPYKNNDTNYDENTWVCPKHLGK